MQTLTAAAFIAVDRLARTMRIGACKDMSRAAGITQLLQGRGWCVSACCFLEAALVVYASHQWQQSDAASWEGAPVHMWSHIEGVGPPSAL